MSTGIQISKNSRREYREEKFRAEFGILAQMVRE